MRVRGVIAERMEHNAGRLGFTHWSCVSMCIIDAFSLFWCRVLSLSSISQPSPSHPPSFHTGGV